MQLIEASIKLQDLCCDSCDATTKKPCAGSKKCGSPFYVADGNCDDNNNNCGCDWDGGDCCGSSGKKYQYSYCKMCACLDPEKQHLVTTVATTTVDENCNGKCGLAAFASDGNCDDENNNCGCNWDNGDCCGKNGNQHQYGYCKSCKCLDPSVTTTKGKATIAVTVDPNCNGVCGAPNFKGDKRCDDNNNNCACNWDGGDCCGKSGDPHQFSYCNKKTGCKCVDPSFTTPATTENLCPGECGSADWVGDGRCDDNNNNCGCKYDGGDCCGDSGDKYQYSYCDKTNGCKCLDPSVTTKATTTVPTTTADKSCLGECGSAQYVGDGNCDDKNNNCGCKWDGGDCCGTNGNKWQYSYCKECKCKDPSIPTQPPVSTTTSTTKKCSKKCENPKYKKDGRCDDENNHCGCGWDGGDCCGSSGDNLQWSYCKKCKCVDPDFDDGGCTGSCGSAAWKGDGNCDDSNNNCGCEYDGGDCCGKSGSPYQYSYCSECKCKDKSVTTKPGCNGSCGTPAFAGDGRCDDNNNNCACGWDSGDCCGKSGDKWQFSYCTKCQCKDPKIAKQTACPGKKECEVKSYIGDGRCDDNNNYCSCGWDQGDCCGSSGDSRQFLYCSACKCNDPSKKKTDCSGTCGSVQYKSDGRCDDNNNNCGCDYDGGDCCGSSGDSRQWDYCSQCKCVDPSYEKKGDCKGSKGGCLAKQWVGDGRCDDLNNNCACNWDEGDCCGKSGDSLQFEYCTACACLDPAKKKAGCPGSGQCGAKPYLGDKRCDDENNNCGCNWDNGDCCGKSGDNLQYSYCKTCKCLDPAKKKSADPLKTCAGTCKTPGWKGDKRCDDGNNNCGCGWDGV